MVLLDFTRLVRFRGSVKVDWVLLCFFFSLLVFLWNDKTKNTRISRGWVSIVILSSTDDFLPSFTDAWPVSFCVCARMGPKYFVTGALGLIETANKRSLRRNQMRPDGMGEAFHRTRVFFFFFFLFFLIYRGVFFIYFLFLVVTAFPRDRFPILFFCFCFFFWFVSRRTIRFFSPSTLPIVLFFLSQNSDLIYLLFFCFFSSFLETSFLERPRVKSRAKRIEVYKLWSGIPRAQQPLRLPLALIGCCGIDIPSAPWRRHLMMTTGPFGNQSDARSAKQRSLSSSRVLVYCCLVGCFFMFYPSSDPTGGNSQ